MLVKDVMNTAPLQGDKNCSLKQAIKLMAEHNQSSLIVTDNQRPLGIVTERDLTLAFARSLELEQALPQLVADVMSSPALCIQENIPFEEALKLSRIRNLRHLPVVNVAGILKGIVSQSSLLNAFSQLVNSNNELEQVLKELQEVSLADPLMRIGNRRAMERDLDSIQADFEQHQKPYSIALLDVDYFKRYNDHYGHSAGDEVLIKVAQTIQQALRTSDRVYRFGGEELLVLMPQTELANAQKSIERIRAQVQAQKIEHQHSDFGLITISAGISQAYRDNWKALIDQADIALYRAKTTGRNRVCSS